jgi:hypothetical protein
MICKKCKQELIVGEVQQKKHGTLTIWKHKDQRTAVLCGQFGYERVDGKSWNVKLAEGVEWCECPLRGDCGPKIWDSPEAEAAAAEELRQRREDNHKAHMVWHERVRAIAGPDAVSCVKVMGYPSIFGDDAWEAAKVKVAKEDTALKSRS